MKIYIACSLTHVPRQEFLAYSSLIEKIAQSLTKAFKAEVKYALKDSDPQLSHKPFIDRARLCYVWDREMVEWADILIAEASYPSIGLGIEMQIACSEEIPIILAFKQDEDHRAQPIQYQTPDRNIHDLQLGDGYVSLMALGMPNIFKIVPYLNDQSALVKIHQAIETLHKPTNET